jgi:hypothetical protein
MSNDELHPVTEQFSIERYIERVKSLDEHMPHRHENNVLYVLQSLLDDRTPLWAIKNFLETVS